MMNSFVFIQDVFKTAAPVTSGIGMYLLQKMGWKMGEGLGKNNEGLREPLMLDFKVDRKGRLQVQMFYMVYVAMIYIIYF